MSKSIAPSEETKTLFTKWSQKAGVTVDELIEQYSAQYAEAQKRTPGKTPAWYDRVARTRVYVHLKGRRYVRAKPYDGIFLGIGAAFDLTVRQRAAALEILRTNPEKAHNEGWVNDMGEPIDMRKTLASGATNPFHGRVLQETFVRQSVALGRPATGGELKIIILQHFREQAQKIPPLGTPVRFLANLRFDEPKRYVLNTSIGTQYDPIKMSEFAEEMTMQATCDLLMGAPDEFKSNLAELEEWHKEHEADIRRIVIVEGSVVFVRRQSLTTGNYFMVLEDESIMDVEGEGVMVWVHSELADRLDFGAGSRVIVIGRSVMGFGFDRETRQIDRSVQRGMINALGIWAEPEFLIPREEERVIEPTETS